jgi:hypothetical protein
MVRGLYFGIIDFAFTNVLASGFTTDFGVIDYAFIKILVRIFDFALAVNLERRDSPSPSLNSSSPTIWSERGGGHHRHL